LAFWAFPFLNFNLFFFRISSFMSWIVLFHSALCFLEFIQAFVYVCFNFIDHFYNQNF
jgi:hypothetical protein